MASPTTPITNPAFNDRSSAQTDVTRTWRKFGWTPLAEKKPAHKPSCASLTTLLLSMPPKPAPCDCGATQ